MAILAEYLVGCHGIFPAGNIGDVPRAGRSGRYGAELAVRPGHGDFDTLFSAGQRRITVCVDGTTDDLGFATTIVDGIARRVLAPHMLISDAIVIEDTVFARSGGAIATGAGVLEALHGTARHVLGPFPLTALTIATEGIIHADPRRSVTARSGVFDAFNLAARRGLEPIALVTDTIMIEDTVLAATRVAVAAGAGVFATFNLITRSFLEPILLVGNAVMVKHTVRARPRRSITARAGVLDARWLSGRIEAQQPLGPAELVFGIGWVDRTLG